MSKEELLAQVWPEQYVRDAVLHTCILTVRKALHDAGRTPSLVHTVRGRGYRFVAPVEEQGAAGDRQDPAAHRICAQSTRSVHREAVAYFEQAIGALPHLLETRTMREQAIDLRLALRSAPLPSGDFGRVLETLREAEALAMALNAPRRLGQISVFLAIHLYIRGAYAQCSAAAQRALTLAASSGEVVLHALANLYLGRVYEAHGDYRQAINYLRQDCRAMQFSCLTLFRKGGWGGFGTARTGTSPLVPLCQGGNGAHHRKLNDPGQTVASLDGAPRHERCGQVILPAVSSRASLVVCHAELGVFAVGRALGEEGLLIAEAADHGASHMYTSWGMGLLALYQGDLHGAPPMLERAIGICQDAHLLGAIVARSDPPQIELAAAHYHEALTLANALGMRPLQAHCHRGFGALYATAGQAEQARHMVGTPRRTG